MKKVLPVAVFALSAVWLSITGNLDGDFRIDEAHKISETYFLRLIERGDFRNPDWVSSPIERSNPPVGKVIFGLAIQAAGVALPADMTFAAHPDPAGRPLQFRPALKPVRVVSLLATSGAAAAACVLAGPLASLLFMGGFLVNTYGTSGIFDPLLTFLVIAAALPVARKVTWPRTVAAACIAALAFDTRASGALAILGVCILIGRDWRKSLAAVAICGAVATALNPAVWFIGWLQPFRDLTAILASTGEHRLTPLEKIDFVSEYAFGDPFGIAILLGLPFAFWRTEGRVRWWCAAIVIVFTAWLPVGYPRYVMVVMPPLAVAAAIGYRQLAVIGGNLVSKRRRST